jgi:hypothetical protein
MLNSNLKISPDIESFLQTLMNKKANHIPLTELGVHPIIKEKLLSKK